MELLRNRFKGRWPSQEAGLFPFFHLAAWTVDAKAEAVEATLQLWGDTEHEVWILVTRELPREP